MAEPVRYQNELEECIALCKSDNWDTARGIIQKLLKNEQAIRKADGESFLQSAYEALKVFKSGKGPQAVGCTTDCLRCLRQACALNTTVQEKLSTCTELLETVQSIIDDVLTASPMSDADNVLKCAVQFLGNACVSNEENQKIIWHKFQPQISRLVQHTDSKVCDYTCMLVHSCLSGAIGSDQSQWDNPTGLDIVLGCIQAVAQRDVEWGLYVLQDMLKTETFLARLFSKLGLKERLLLLEVILAEINELPPSGATPPSESIDPQSLAISPGNMDLICNIVKHECNLLLEIDGSERHGQEEALVLAKQVEAISIAAQQTDMYPSIQQDSELLQCAINILHTIHKMGQASGDSVFHREEKASAMDNVDPHHPVYGLKKDLTRLIANMVYKHKENQDLVRSLDGIPLLLDHTMMDSRNPYITQWVVLAIRNLVEGNRDNRDALSGLSLQGLAGHMSQLRDVGIHTQLKGGKIVVKPAD